MLQAVSRLHLKVKLLLFLFTLKKTLTKQSAFITMSEILESIKSLENNLLCYNNNKNKYIASKLPEICKTDECILGIDEAGRGPVLGPMVYGICYCPKNKENELKETGCADSKTLSEKNRENIFDKMCNLQEFIGWEVEIIAPTVISNSMFRRSKISLNEISHNAAISLIKRALEIGANISEVYVDTVGPAEKYQAKLEEIFPTLKITVSKKADSIYPIVSAASICAKVTRDICLRNWKFNEIDEKEGSFSWGSGYPTDPETKKFLQNNIDPIFGFPQLVRFSWSTAEKILEEKSITVEWENIDVPKNTATVKSFFQKSGEGVIKNKHRFFKDRNINNISNL